MPDFRPTYLWIERLEPGRYGHVMVTVEIDAPRAYEGGGQSEAWYVWHGGLRDVLAVADVCHDHVHNQGWMWRTGSPEKFPGVPFLLTDDPGTKTAYDGPVGVRPTDSIRELIEGEIESFGHFAQALREPDWVGAIFVVRTEAESGHLVAFSKTGTIPEAGVLMLPDLDEPFGAIDMPDGRTLGSAP